VAPVTPPTYLQAGSYPARYDRLAVAGLLTPHYGSGPLVARSGVKPTPSSTGMQVIQRPTPDRWVRINAGSCYIGATSTLGGSYECHNDADYDVQTSASHATLNRKDLIVAQVRDAVDDTGVNNDYIITVVTGTPASSPALPATPNQAIALAQVQVNATTTTVTNANITDLRQYVVGLGGVLPCTGSSQVPANPYPGMKIWRSDLTSEQIWDGTAWQPIGYGALTAYTPSLIGSTTSPTLGTGSVRNGSYFQLGKLVIANAHIKFGSSGTAAGSGFYMISLPVAPKSIGSGLRQVGSLWAYDDSGNDYEDGAVIVDGSNTRVQMMVAGTWASNSVPWTWAANDLIGMQITYEAA
jgi:hypothetical protein